MATAQEVAEWTAAHFETASRLYQESAVYKIRQQFGPEHVYKNESGNLAISKDILKRFRALTEGKVVWERGVDLGASFAQGKSTRDARRIRWTRRRYG